MYSSEGRKEGAHHFVEGVFEVGNCQVVDVILSVRVEGVVEWL